MSGAPAALDTVRQRPMGGGVVLGLRYRKDPAAGTRFDALTREIGERFIRVELEGNGQATLTAHRQQEGVVYRVLAFFAERLHPPA